MKSGFVNIFGKPNAGKSTLLNALIGEKLAIVSPKVQTTRHRIKAFLNKPGAYQLVLSDTPGIIQPKYLLQNKMMEAVTAALEDADLAVLLVDVNDNLEELDQLFSGLKLRVPSIVVLNKIDIAANGKIKEAVAFFTGKLYSKELVKISALQQHHLLSLIDVMLKYIPEGQPFFSEEDLSDLPTRFFVSELIREKIYELFGDEIPYQTAVVVNEYAEKAQLIKIQADIIVNRESQKAIVLGDKGSMIKQLGMMARKDIEAFIGSKVFLELFIKVRPKWRDNDLHLKEYGYR
ncbi:MAG: GTPase Era [Chitinophagia bacterium]|jgi:GTP-binding protein Era